MASYNKYDPRLESLVMETRTLWDPAVGEISPEDQAWLAEEVQKHPERAAKINYDRSHTGFAREITVTVADVERIYDERMAAH
jgi:hypothetical protein